MLDVAMKPHGTYTIPRRRSPDSPGRSHHPALRRIGYDPLLDPILGGGPRLQRLLGSLRDEIVVGGVVPTVRVRLVFSAPRDIYRLEL
jgi:hypothetical protein